MDFAKPRTLWLLSAASPRSVSVDPDWGGEGVIGCVITHIKRSKAADV